MSTAVITDSTATLPAAVVAEHGIRVVPLQLVIDGGERIEGDGADASVVVDALHRKAEISTSRPSPATFLRAYEQAAKGGADDIISLHLSGGLSGTVEAARAAADEAPVPVRVVDSRSVGMGLGFAVIGAARDAAAGRELPELVERAELRCGATSVRLVVHSLDRLHRGGRIGGARALLGSALAIKPVLHMVDGHVEPLERVRTAGRAIARLQELTVAECEALPDWADGVEVGVHHLDAATRAEPLAAALAERIEGPVELAPMSAVIGAHVGLGTIGVVVSPRPL
ncbi:DegV family protein [Janibacter indicus]|uniref:DegV family protein n=1 Tax=Janibacter indicus TaxID=857417 RepID=UPI003D9A6AA8